MISIDKIREKLIEAIKQSGLSQTELAKQIGVVPQSVAQYFSGRAMPALDTFAKICAVLDIDPADILCIDDYNKDWTKIIYAARAIARAALLFTALP